MKYGRDGRSGGFLLCGKNHPVAPGRVSGQWLVAQEPALTGH